MSYGSIASRSARYPAKLPIERLLFPKDTVHNTRQFFRDQRSRHDLPLPPRQPPVLPPDLGVVLRGPDCRRVKDLFEAIAFAADAQMIRGGRFFDPPLRFDRNSDRGRVLQ